MEKVKPSLVPMHEPVTPAEAHPLSISAVATTHYPIVVRRIEGAGRRRQIDTRYMLDIRQNIRRSGDDGIWSWRSFTKTMRSDSYSRYTLFVAIFFNDRLNAIVLHATVSFTVPPLAVHVATWP